MEHTEPISALIRELVREDRTDAELAALLADRLTCVVVTRDEDRRIERRATASSPEGDSDPYARYLAARHQRGGHGTARR